MSKRASVAEVKARFADFVRVAETGEPVVITRHGRPVVALVAASDMDQLQRLRAAGPASGLAGLAGGWEGSEELVAHVSEIGRTRPRSDPEDWG